MQTEMLTQGSEAWKQARIGYVTASRFGDVMTNPRGKGNGNLSKTAESYLLELVGEHLTGKPTPDFETYAMRWGTQHEPLAREAYTWATGNLVTEVGFELHDTEELIGSSPDGFVSDEGIVEIKCPLTFANHVRVLLSGQMPAEHVDQVQGNLWITGRKWADFISFHPHCKQSKSELAVVRVPRDEKYIGLLAEQVVRFRDKLLETLALIRSRTTCKS